MPVLLRCLALCCLFVCLTAGEDPADRAALDPAQAVPLLIEGSAALAKASVDDLPRLAGRLDPLARHIFLHGWQVPGRTSLGLLTHTIASGDTLSRIGRTHGVPYDLLIRLNSGLDPRRLRIGQRITVLDTVTVPLRVDIRLSARLLLVWRGTVLVLACPIGVGAGGTPTPTGTTRIAVRAKNPEWRDPATGTVHPPGSPGNLLGGFWLGFDPGPDRRFRSIGCHGWTGDDPTAWLGQAGSRGCLRLRQADIADLYDLLLAGTSVTVR